MIQTALQITQITQSHPKNDTIQSFLLSPYINSHHDDQCLAAMVVSDNQFHEKQLSTQYIESLIARLTKYHFPHSTLLRRWKKLHSIAPIAKTENLQNWAAHIQILLDEIGWPGHRALDSNEYQILQRWHQLLLDFAKLDRLFPSTTEQHPFDLLLECCSQIVFQSESFGKPIQILGMLEASGCEFDHLWIMGLTDEVWPPKANPNPFIPIDLQRKLSMPHASAQRELQYSNQIQQRLLASSKNIIISSTQQRDDTILFPSPLIKSIPKTEIPFESKPDPSNSILEKIADDYGPVVTNNEAIHGGSWILQQQALCPFRAFANVRLHTQSMNKPEVGLDAKKRGILCHKVLEIIWKTIKTQDNLITLSKNNIQKIIAQSIDEATKQSQLPENLYLNIEKKRLRKLLLLWLEIEKERPPFKVIERETKRHIKIGELTLRIQIDRIDELEHGEMIIIDYKTGKNNSIHHWFGERLLQPQLPLYCLYGTDHAIGIAYAEINLSKPQFIGIIDQTTEFSKIHSVDKAFKQPLSWEGLRQQWNHSIEKLSEEFCQGKATVDPQNKQTCQFCQLHTFCRIENTK